MEQFGVSKMEEIAHKKLSNFKTMPMQFFVYSMMAGVFCGLGMILAYSAGGSLAACEYTAGWAKIVFAISFSLSFTFIVYAGSELFTGSIGVMLMSVLDKSIKPMDFVKVLAFIYFGNFVGATLIALLIGAAGILEIEATATYIVNNCAIKMALPFSQAFFRGILCNMLVMLAVWSYSKIESHTAKLIIIVWCVYGFCASGFEHSIANMALFVMSMISPFTTADISFAGYLNNIIPVTLGNLVGGLGIGGIYYFVGTGKSKQ